MVSIKRTLKAKSQPGFVLIAVLLIITILAAIILEFNYESRMKLHLADNFHHATQALNNADAGIAMAMTALSQNEDMLVDETTRPSFSGMVQIPVEDGFCTVSIAKESGKININSLRTSDGRPIRHRVNQMLRLIDLLNDQYGESSPVSYSLVPAIIDWVDSDDDVTILPFVKGQNAGAENDYYQKLEEPYPCKNAPFDALSELLLVKGMTTEIFHGRMGNRDQGIKPVSGMNQYLTIYGDGMININEAPIMVIQSLSESISPIVAQNIIEQRKYSRYSNVDQLRQVPGMTAEMYEDIHDLITVNTNDNYYIVTGTGVVKEFERTVQVVLRKNRQTPQIDVVMRCEI